MFDIPKPGELSHKEYGFLSRQGKKAYKKRAIKNQWPSIWKDLYTDLDRLSMAMNTKENE